MADPVGFLVGPVSEGAAKVLALGVGVYALLTARHTWTAFQKGLADRGSALLATWVMAGLTVLLWTEGALLLPAPFSLAVMGLYVGGITITLAYTLGDAEKTLLRWRDQVRRAVDEWAAKALPESQREAWLERRFWELDPEQRRKTPHLMMGLYLLAYTVLGYLILRGIHAAVPADQVVGENLHNLRAALDAGVLASGHMVGLTALLGLLFLLLPVEMVRLRFPQLGYPFKGTITSMMRDRERGLFGAHYYITATLPLAIMLVARDSTTWDTTLFAVLAMLGVTIFADTASALVGIRWGRRKWPHNPNKSYVGTFGGAAVAFAVAIAFVGFPVAVVSAVVFVIVDVLAPVPFSASDNILNPMALAATYIATEAWLAPWIPFY